MGKLQDGTLKVENLPATPSFGWTSASLTHVGRVRDLNEDACLDEPQHGLWAVADGMGGHSLGDYASRMAVESLKDLPVAENLEQRVDAAVQRLQDVNRRLRAEALRRDVSLIGTTIAALVVAGRRCSCLWAGDSRIYMCRDGQIRQLTRDHSHLESARSQFVAGADDTLSRPRANLITRALGAEDDLQIETSTFELVDGDTFLLCSDGLSNEVSESSMEQALVPGVCGLACEQLIEMALARGARDNVTAVVVGAEDLDSPDRTIMRDQ